MKKVLVAGASGGIGTALVKELRSRSIVVHAFARNKAKLNQLYGETPHINIFTGDALHVEEMARAANGVDTIFHAVSFPYPDWPKTHMRCLENLIQLAEEQQAKVVLIDNIYAYGNPKTSHVTENTIKQPHTKKGKLRYEMEMTLKKSGVPYTIVHLPDLYGPNATNTILYETLKNVSKNKQAIFVGPMNTAREYVFTEDAAKATIELALNSEAVNQCWNIPASHPVTGDELLTIVKDLGYTKSFRPISKNAIRLLGIFSPFMRELTEMMYLTETPVILNGKKYEQLMGGIETTPYAIGLEKTIAWIKGENAN
ncbi:SDR family NAD(P)-dependent oxidoreductase [Salipaludibacillus sp. LMS25]|jgi:nucleoside-diphosphate-sugar epimerase|uniref:NAD(P)H-binding protein n=1 Tax=Salipaludibacillus sp. LMS25 TaxID=2924031 RepID=UPI0020D1A66B|nr:NAD(P)H-binding protein [Salipaludibacillus sp. LMS25]UTR13740.1 SDR family NAD(P)-dependent oxidoreductase [Salipaludibacillus sp. LMS25]